MFTVAFWMLQKPLIVNNYKLFKKLTDRGVPAYLVRIIVYWYTHQVLYVRWQNVLSTGFTVTNGVRQGGILSPYLFCVYMDDLSALLNSEPIGCVLGEAKVNHLMYADDLVLLAPSAKGLRKLLKVCELYGLNFNIEYNNTKSSVLLFKCKSSRKSTKGTFLLNGENINTDTQYKYLGHIITDNLRDELDIERQRKKIYAQGNILNRKFFMCSEDVKITLFRAFCSPMYTPHLWWNYSRFSINKLYIAYNNVFRILCREPKWCSASLMFVSRRTPTCREVIRNLIYKFMLRLKKSDNLLLKSICGSDIYFKSSIWKHWRNIIYVH